MLLAVDSETGLSESVFRKLWMFAVKGATITVSVRTTKSTIDTNSTGSCLFTDLEERVDIITISFQI